MSEDKIGTFKKNQGGDLPQLSILQTRPGKSAIDCRQNIAPQAACRSLSDVESGTRGV